MDILKRHVEGFGALIIALGVLHGIVGGWGFAVLETQRMMRLVLAERPHDSLDGFPFIFLGIWVICSVVGTVSGVAGALIFKLRAKAALSR